MIHAQNTHPPIDEFITRFKKAYPGPARPRLEFADPYECVVAVSLSAQTTDLSVNRVTPELFARYPDVYAMASADQAEVSQIIHSLGFFNNKAKNLIGMARRVIAEYDGVIPDTMDDLMTLPGVARKTANIVLNSSFGIVEGIAVDTHVFRVAHRLGLSDAKTADATERDLCDAFPREHWGRVNYEMINLGRAVCDAKKPQCATCFLNDLCPTYAEFEESPTTS
jgi:endonuclease-3